MNTTSTEVMDRDRETTAPSTCPSPASAPSTCPAPASAPLRGLKRTADDSLDDDNRFAKRFDLLNLANNHDKLYIPVSSRPQLPRRPWPAEEHMQLDDTKDRVYIHNLDDELADIESDQEKLIFLPDIEKKLNAIPRHVLMPADNKDSHQQQLVLYDLAPSLSVPVEQDNVRKVILEARQRAKEKAATLPASPSSAADGRPPQDQVETAHGYDSPDYGLDQDIEDTDDDDAMDLS